MILSLGGCFGADLDVNDQSDNGTNPFSCLVLILWTLLLAGYTWWMLRSPFPHAVPAQVPTPTWLAVGPVVTHDTTTLEGLWTWTYARVLGRLARAIRDNNLGRIRKYTESRHWLQRGFADLRHGNLATRERMHASITGDSWMKKMDLHHMGMERWSVSCWQPPMVKSSVNLFQLETSEKLVELIRGIGTSA